MHLPEHERDFLAEGWNYPTPNRPKFGQHCSQPNHLRKLTATLSMVMLAHYGRSASSALGSCELTRQIRFECQHFAALQPIHRVAIENLCLSHAAPVGEKCKGSSHTWFSPCPSLYAEECTTRNKPTRNIVEQKQKEICYRLTWRDRLNCSHSLRADCNCLIECQILPLQMKAHS